MFNKKLKLKIEKLESEIQELILRSNKFTDIINDNFIGIEGKKQVPIFGWSYSDDVIDYTFYLPKGTEPNCDYIKQDKNGKRTYYKKDVICDEKGNIKK